MMIILKKIDSFSSFNGLQVHFRPNDFGHRMQLAMVKNQRLAAKLINGNIYDCVCRFEPAS